MHEVEKNKKTKKQGSKISSPFIQQHPEDADHRTSNSDEQKMSESIWNMDSVHRRQSNWEGKEKMGQEYGGSLL